MLDMTPVCENCGKVAPVDEEMSTPEWTVHRVNEACECGGRFKPKCLLEVRDGAVCLD